MKTTPTAHLNNLVSAFNHEGDLFDAGCDECDIDLYKSKSRKLFPYKSICVVKSWMWWDFEVTEEQSSLLKQNGQHASLIKADNVIDDETGRFRSGDWVRSSPLVSFTENCIFETQNTVYLLVGKGSRKTVSLDTAIAFV
ncbi:DUF6957 family protein [Colwellia psychrerythraea]|uniref:DUF6957 domain-containing protein n=1 Tax=Colwellia psychrerythraea TaxID=28229 RepID=A0A099KH37_COLPS|nr:hypothetical protein [Colwellia psychrerythraea]KGJ89621.1 hypothetical protein ND2E_3812 [Colwellia psychrerythraea]